MNLDKIITHLEQKIVEVKSLKDKLNSSASLLHQAKIRHQTHDSILQDLQRYHEQQLHTVKQIINYYQDEAKKHLKFYEYEMNEMKSEIKRQYKVIGLMKQEVEDLMFIVNNQRQSHQNCTQKRQQSPKNQEKEQLQTEKSSKQIKTTYIEDTKLEQEQQDSEQSHHNEMKPLSLKYMLSDRLEIIEEEVTDRTIPSSSRSQIIFQTENSAYNSADGRACSQANGHQEVRANQQIDIQITQQSNSQDQQIPNLADYSSNNQIHYCRKNYCQPSNQPDNKPLKVIFHEEVALTHSTINSHSWRNKREGQTIETLPPTNTIRNSQATDDLYHSVGELQTNDRALYPTPQEGKQCYTETPLNPNILRGFEQMAASMQDSDSERGYSDKPHQEQKMKHFLENFQKTFSKCLKTVGQSKKNEQKSNSKTADNFYKRMQPKKPNMLATFGKNKTKLDKQDKNIEHHQRQQSQGNRDMPLKALPVNDNRAITAMLKELDNSNKFLVGTKKIELRYQGDKKDNQRHGSGLLYYSNGLCFQGQFRHGVRNGYGILRFNHIEIYNGDWANDEICGQGKIRNCAIINKKKMQSQTSALCKWISFCGDFKSNRFQGEGTLYLQGGEKFLGRFIAGVACGEGTLYKKNGEIQTGIWKNNYLVQKF